MGYCVFFVSLLSFAQITDILFNHQCYKLLYFGYSITRFETNISAWNEHVISWTIDVDIKDEKLSEIIHPVMYEKCVLFQYIKRLFGCL